MYTKACLHCGVLFNKQYTRSVAHWSKYAKFCSKACLGKSRIGTKFTEEHKLKISRALTGKFIGENSWMWRGGVSKPNEIFRKRTGYLQRRKKVFDRDDYTCQICFIRGGQLHADHIKRFAEFPDLRTVLSNGRTLCVSCHRDTDTYGVRTLKVKEEISI